MSRAYMITKSGEMPLFVVGYPIASTFRIAYCGVSERILNDSGAPSGRSRRLPVIMRPKLQKQSA